MGTSAAVVGGNPAIAYYNVNSFDAMFVRANDATGGTWNAPVTVYATGLSGQHVSMAQVDGRPAMSFYSDTAGLGLMFARANDPTGGAWSVIGVDTQTFESVGLYSSLAVVDGVPAISYYSLTAGDLKYVRAANASGTVWNAGVTVDALGNQGEYCALTSVTGRPGISYYDADNGHLRFVTDPNEPFAIQWIAVEP